MPFGVTDFTLKHTGSLAAANAVPTRSSTHVRVDVAAGLAPVLLRYRSARWKNSAAKKRSKALASMRHRPAKRGGGPHGIGPESTVIGEETATVYVARCGPTTDVTMSGTLYNLVQPEPPATRTRVAVRRRAQTPETSHRRRSRQLDSGTRSRNAQYYAHTLVEGNVEWGKEAKGTDAGDYHDYFEVMVSPALPVIRSRQEDYGMAGNGAS